jgi:hypothetical protein
MADAEETVLHLHTYYCWVPCLLCISDYRPRRGTICIRVSRLESCSFISIQFFHAGARVRLTALSDNRSVDIDV